MKRSEPTHRFRIQEEKRIGADFVLQIAENGIILSTEHVRSNSFSSERFPTVSEYILRLYLMVWNESHSPSFTERIRRLYGFPIWLRCMPN